jgi:hypothetical protein
MAIRASNSLLKFASAKHVDRQAEKNMQLALKILHHLTACTPKIICSVSKAVASQIKKTACGRLFRVVIHKVIHNSSAYRASS